MMLPVGTGYSITIFLPDGAPTGVRIARRSHWTGEVLMCPRTLYPSVSSREEFGRTGTYILVGKSDDGSEASQVYVGEGDIVRSRLKSHFDNKDFWNDVVVITKSDGSLTKTDVRYLEAKLVELAKKSPTVSVENGTTPWPPEPPEAHKADLDSFLVDTLAILRLLGVTAFSTENASARSAPQNSTPQVPVPTKPSTDETAAGEYSFAIGKASGTMTVTADSYILHPGDGIARIEKQSLTGTQRALRQNLLASGTLVEIENDPNHLRLTREVSFSSPSAAAVFLYGAAINGRTAWRDSEGKSLARRETEALEDDG